MVDEGSSENPPIPINTQELRRQRLEKHDKATLVYTIFGLEELNRLKDDLITHDSLIPDLYNLTGFEDAVSRDVARIRRSETDSALIMFVDIDGFKGVNDNVGHDMGDKLLKDTGEIVKRNIRLTDVAARRSGDEFLIEAYNAKSEDVALIKMRIKEDYNKKVDSMLSGRVSTSLSIGVAEIGDFPIEEEDEKNGRKIKKVVGYRQLQRQEWEYYTDSQLLEFAIKVAEYKMYREKKRR